MTTVSKKRTRPETADDNKAECPFTITYVSPEEKALAAKKGKKRRKQSEVEEEDVAKLQNSPFAPSGRFKTDDTLDLHYRVEPRDKWLAMTRYNSFVLNQAKYFSEGFIYVANDSTVSQREAAAEASTQPKRRQQDEWVARILEIRAADEHHVYARVYWMYWPEELPVGTKDSNGKFVSGRQPYHGQNELVASNHMDVINVVSVTSEAKVKQWYEENDDEVQDALYWRQAFDVRSMQLSSIQRTCKCNEPANPDKTLVACPLTDGSCGKWLHEDCLKHEALMRTFEALGKDKPYIKPGSEPKTNGEANGETNGETKAAADAISKTDEESGRPLSPPDNGTEIQQTIDAKVDDAPEEKVKPVEDDAKVTELREAQGTPVVDGPILAQPSSVKKGRGRKKASGGDSNRPYEGLFEAELRLAESPSMVEIRDLRENVEGGEKVWKEKLDCLLCGTTIS